ncbi:MAG: iron-containing alcohol dehydrogenase [Deltaproteobacteria bacterium]|nr:iron-containing alcohol dehydrogenase [Deltaproteobacteria bacterium]
MSYGADLNFNYFAPTRVVFGVGSVSELPFEVGQLGRKAVLVTDEGLISAGMVDPVAKMLGAALAGIYTDIPQDSSMAVVDRAADYALSLGADVVVSLGGGSVMDTAKGMCLVMKEGGSLRDFQGMQMLTRSQTPHITIPTTAGTGSEVTSAAVVMDREQGQKILIYEYFITPQVAILDPKLTEKLPPGLTASTGMDALSHAVECYLSLQRNPISDSAALHAVRLITRFLPAAVDNGRDLAARGQMQLAALLAGWAFSNALLGLTHALAHALGAVCGLAHGLGNGILLPQVMRYNLEEVPGLLADIAAAMEGAPRGLEGREAGEAAVSGMEDFLKRIGHPTRLRDVGIEEGALRACADLALSDGSIIYNPRMVADAEEVLTVLKRAY